MKYSDLISFDPIESIIQLTNSNDYAAACALVKSYVMSDNMAEQIRKNMLSQLSLDDVVDNKGVLLVGNYGTGKSHLMSLISAVALDADNLQHLQNRAFADDIKSIAGQFEVLRIEIGAVTTPLREIVLSKIKQDFANRGLSFDYPDADTITNNKETLIKIMELFGSKYPDKGYLIVVDEFLDFLGGKNDHAVRLDLGFMREIGESVKNSRMRVIFSVQEKLFDNPAFSFVSNSINKIRDRFEQVIIRKEDTAFVVSERILKKTSEQKALIREHLQKFCAFYSNMSERIEEYVNLFPIHPSYIDVFNKIYIIENRHILANISKSISGILDNELYDDEPGIVSFDSYWAFIRDNFSYRTDANIKEVVEKSGQLEDIVARSFPKRLYKPLALKIINALSVHRLTTGDIQIRAGLTSENLRDDLCLYIKDLPDHSSDTLQSLVQTVLKDIMTTVSGQFIDHNSDNGQYYLDLKKDVDYDEKITQRAAILDEDSLNEYFYKIIYYCLDWEQNEYVPSFKIYEHTLNWDSHNIFRRGYLFLGTPESRPTAQPPEDYYIYFVPPYGRVSYTDEKKTDEVFFSFKPSEEFKNNLKLYAAACILHGLAEDKNKPAYMSKSEKYRKILTKFLSENKNTCFETIYSGGKKQLLEVMKGRYKQENPFKETMDLVASLLLDGYFNGKYPEFPVFKTKITLANQAETIRAGINHFSGQGQPSQLGRMMLDSFCLLSGDMITVQNSKYAGYYANMLSNAPAGGVINFMDICEQAFDDFYVDKKFRLSYALLPIPLLGLVYAGFAVITLKNGTTITASNLDSLPKMSPMDIYEFKHISKPKDVQLAELVRLFEILCLPAGLIRDMKNREHGLTMLIAKTQEVVQSSVKAKSKLDGDFSLWGEPLVPAHIATGYKEAGKRVADMLGNFASRFNTVAKLNNFTYTMEEIEKLGKDIVAVNTVLEYEIFRENCGNNVRYLMSVEPLSIGDTLKTSIENAKVSFRKIRDDIADDKFGETAAAEVNEQLVEVKDAYINLYFDEHKKRRMTVKDGQKKGLLINSPILSNLKRLSLIEILSCAKLKAIENDLSALKICYELTPELMKTTSYCSKCLLQLGSNEPIVKGALDSIEDRLDTLTSEWTNTLVNTISDPLVVNGKQYLSADKKKVIDEFLDKKELPEKVDQFFLSAIADLLKGFEAVTVSGTELIDKLSGLGACDMETFKSKVDEIVAGFTKGKDTTKLRIIVRQ